MRSIGRFQRSAFAVPCKGGRGPPAMAMLSIATGSPSLHPARHPARRHTMEATQTLVNITDKAAEKAKALLEARELPEGALRVFVAGGGCSGYQYGMALARSAEDDDIILEQSGIRILV